MKTPALLLAFCVSIITAVALLSSCSAQPGGVYGADMVRIYTDPDTGCQYLVQPSSNSADYMTPRLNRDGAIICNEPTSKE